MMRRSVVCQSLFIEDTVVANAMVRVNLGIEFTCVTVAGEYRSGDDGWRFAVADTGDRLRHAVATRSSALLQFAKQGFVGRTQGYAYHGMRG
jgi:hypothetical protein